MINVKNELEVFKTYLSHLSKEELSNNWYCNILQTRVIGKFERLEDDKFNNCPLSIFYQYQEKYFKELENIIYTKMSNGHDEKLETLYNFFVADKALDVLKAQIKLKKSIESREDYPQLLNHVSNDCYELMLQLVNEESILQYSNHSKCYKELLNRFYALKQSMINLDYITLSTCDGLIMSRDFLSKRIGDEQVKDIVNIYNICNEAFKSQTLEDLAINNDRLLTIYDNYKRIKVQSKRIIRK